MSGYVYLIRNGDIYKIGATNNLQKKIKLLKPDEVIKIVKSDNSDSMLARLFRRYKSNRIPDTEYFRLSPKQLFDCKKELSPNGVLPKSLKAEFSISLTGSILLIISTFIVSIYFGKGFVSGMSFAFLCGSIPFWLLFILGNFGGYDLIDLPLFSSWFNRIKALILGLLLTFLSYFLSYSFSKFL